MTYVGVFLFTLLMLIYRIEVTLGQKCSTTEGKEQKDYSRDALISVIPNTAEDIYFMRQLDRKEIVDLWGEAQPAIGAKKLMRVSRGRLKAVMKDLKNRNMKAIIVSYNLQNLIKQNFNPHVKRFPMKLGAKNFNFNRYHPYKNIELFLKDFTNIHKDVCKLEVFGKSYENRPMYVVKISSSNIGNIFSKNRKHVGRKTKNENTGCGRQRCQKMIIFIDCGIHAREWASISFCLYFLKYLITGYKENKGDFKTILTKYDFLIIPVMNPDGYVYTHEKDRLWRKTRSKNPGSRCVGVDANRNFYSSSEKCENHNPCSEIYCGRKPFSEPETVAFRDLLKRTAGKVKGYFDIHCYGQYWLIPWGKYKWRPKNYCEMERVAAVGVKAVEERHRTKFTFGQVTKVMYVALGAAIDYVYEKGYANYSYALELRDKGDCDTGQCGFLLPEDKIQATCEETTDGVVAAILAMK